MEVLGSEVGPGWFRIGSEMVRGSVNLFFGNPLGAQILVDVLGQSGSKRCKNKIRLFYFPRLGQWTVAEINYSVFCDGLFLRPMRSGKKGCAYSTGVKWGEARARARARERERERKRERERERGERERGGEGTGGE